MKLAELDELMGELVEWHSTDKLDKAEVVTKMPDGAQYAIQGIIYDAEKNTLIVNVS